MLTWILRGLLAITIVGCGDNPLSLPSDQTDTSPNAPRAYTMMVRDVEVVWAYEAERGPLNAPVMGEGLMLENQTPGKVIDADDANLVLLRAANGRMLRGSQLITFLDHHPEDPGISLSYQLDASRPVTAKRLGPNRDTYKIYINLYKAPPSYRNEQGVSSRQIPIGQVTMSAHAPRAYVTPINEVNLAAISQGYNTGGWGIGLFTQSLRDGAITDSTWCETAAFNAGSLSNQSPFADEFNCRPRPSESDLCSSSRGIDGCLAPAPVEQSSPFADVGELDLTFLSAHNSEYRVFTIHPQAPYQAKITATFVAKTIAATSENNAQKCKDLFRAAGWTIGARVNSHCVLTPDPSPEPIEGMLACRVALQFVNDYTVQDKNCYVSGIFNEEEELMEQFLIYRE